MQNSANKKSDPIEIFIISFFKSIAAIFRSVFYGMKRLNKVKALLGLLFFIIAATGAYALRDEIFRIAAPEYVHWMIYCALLVSPLLYLCALGASQSRAIREYYAKFIDINFIGKDKKYPVLLYKKEDGKREILAFKSNIPIENWKKATPQLETAFDCTIANIEQLKSKRKVKLTTINSSYELPTYVEWNDDFIDPADGVVVLGESITGQIKIDLNDSGHVLVGGQPGTGKSVTGRNINWQLMKKGAIPFMFDFKGRVEFGKKYEQYGEVVGTREGALELLKIITKENTLRLQMIHDLEFKKITKLNEYLEKNGEKKLSRIVIVFDEIAEATDKKGASKEEKEIIDGIIGELSTIARQGRAPGISLILITQRPDADVLPGQIKNNIAIRMCGRFKDKSASEIVLGNANALNLPKINGRFIMTDDRDFITMQGYYFDDDKMLGAIDDGVTRRVMNPELQERIAALHAAEASAPEEPKATNTRKAAPTSQSTVNLDFDYRKAVNK